MCILMWWWETCTTPLQSDSIGPGMPKLQIQKQEMRSFSWLGVKLYNCDHFAPSAHKHVCEHSQHLHAYPQVKNTVHQSSVAFGKQNPPKLWNAAHRFPVSVVNDPVLARLGWYRDIPHLLDLNESKNVQTTERCSIRCRQRWNAASWIVAFRVDCCSAEPRSKRMHASTCKRMLW